MIRRLTLAISLFAGILLMTAGPGVRLGLWSFQSGFVLLRWAAYLGLGSAAVAMIQLMAPRWRRSGCRALAAALLIGGIAFAVPWSAMQHARRVPPIHDITTDTTDPPAFVAVLPERATAPNSATYGGPEVAAAQQRAYPGIRPLLLPSPPPAVFAHALATARSMGWTIVAADSSAGRIEATATTRWFGFKDDVVVRVRPEGTGSRVDVRSESRVGKSDLGTNAHRIRAYLACLAKSRIE